MWKGSAWGYQDQKSLVNWKGWCSCHFCYGCSLSFVVSSCGSGTLFHSFGDQEYVSPFKGSYGKRTRRTVDVCQTKRKSWRRAMLIFNVRLTIFQALEEGGCECEELWRCPFLGAHRTIFDSSLDSIRVSTKMYATRQLVSTKPHKRTNTKGGVSFFSLGTNLGDWQFWNKLPEFFSTCTWNKLIQIRKWTKNSPKIHFLTVRIAKFLPSLRG